MNADTRALCYVYRNPPPAWRVKRLSYAKIASIVFMKDGITHPTPQAVFKCVKEWRRERKQRGRKKGWRKTTKAEDTSVLKTFLKVRPPGYGVVSRQVQDSLPRDLRLKICKRTIRNRLKEKGYIPEEKVGKQDPGRDVVSKRMTFSHDHEHRTEAMWQQYLQGCGDIKMYSFYPRRLKLKFHRWRAKWTYMNKAEKHKPAFAKPTHKTFSKKERQSVVRGKVFGLTLSTGAQLLCHIPQPFTSEHFAQLVRSKIGPFFQENFAGRSTYRILLDGEKIFHAPPAQAAMREFGLHVLDGWPPYSPDLNPQENVWPWIENELRRTEARTDSLGVFRARLTRAASKYPDAEKLIPSMAERIQECLEQKGRLTRH